MRQVVLVFLLCVAGCGSGESGSAVPVDPCRSGTPARDSLPDPVLVVDVVEGVAGYDVDTLEQEWFVADHAIWKPVVEGATAVNSGYGEFRTTDWSELGRYGLYEVDLFAPDCSTYLEHPTNALVPVSTALKQVDDGTVVLPDVVIGAETLEDDVGTVSGPDFLIPVANLGTHLLVGSAGIRQDPDMSVVGLTEVDSGDLIWTAPPPDALIRPKIVDDTVFWVDEQSGNGHGFRLQTGEELWTVGGSAERDLRLVHDLPDKQIDFIDGRLRSIDATGIAWELQARTAVGALDLQGTPWILAQTHAGDWAVLDLEGETVNKFDLPETAKFVQASWLRHPQIPVLDDGTVIELPSGQTKGTLPIRNDRPLVSPRRFETGSAILLNSNDQLIVHHDQLREQLVIDVANGETLTQLPTTLND